jgi:hypothetical protein
MASARRRPPRSGSRKRGSWTPEGAGPENPGDERPIYKPAAKKGVNPVVVIVTLVLFIGSGIFFAYALVNRNTTTWIVVEETTTDDEYKKILRRIQKSTAMVSEVVQLRTDEDRARFSRKWSAANKYAGDTFDQLRAMLADVRLPDGSLPPEYSGYNTDFTRLQIIMGDLIKVAPLDFDWDSEE